MRYNAEKTQVGKYYSTPIFQFRMKCHLCDNHFEIRTDPKVGYNVFAFYLLSLLTPSKAFFFVRDLVRETGSKDTF